jgi:glucose-1-phosphate thymidylyltransferase
MPTKHLSILEVKAHIELVSYNSNSAKIQRRCYKLKALILAAGKGTRLKPLTDTLPKHLIPVANKPIIFYAMEQIHEAGIDDIGIVVSTESGPEIKKVVSDGFRWNARVTYVLQSEPLGLAHAVMAAREFLADSSFLLFLGDNLFRDRVKNIVDEFNTCSPDALVVLKEVADPRAFGVAEVNTLGKVQCVVEKPKEPKSNLALAGVYVFTAGVHEAISKLKPSRRGEYEITDAIQKLIEQGKDVHCHTLKGWWLDAGKKEDLLKANRVLLEEVTGPAIYGDVDFKSSISGNIEIGSGTKIVNSTLSGPVSIAENCHIIDSRIGPYTSLGPGTIITDAFVENSIIMAGAHITSIPHIVDSIIGRNVEVVLKAARVEKSEIFAGDYARIEL